MRNLKALTLGMLALLGGVRPCAAAAVKMAGDRAARSPDSKMDLGRDMANQSCGWRSFRICGSSSSMARRVWQV